MIEKDRVVLCFRYIRLPVKSNRRLKLPFEMGGMCSKGVKDGRKLKKEKGLRKSLKLDVDKGGNTPVKYSESSAGSTSGKEEGDKKSTVLGSVEPRMCRVFSVRNGLDGAQVVAGWPSWLASVAGEAVKGWMPRKADDFLKLDKIGQGTYSSVYRARDLEAGKIVALKKVRFVNMDPESVRFMAREILVLRRLDHPNVIKLEGLVFSKVSTDLYFVFEYMEHDLSGLSSAAKFTEPQIKCFMQQLLRGLEHCHNRGVLHRDIKGSNLLIDDNGNLKIADFGLATFFQPNQKQPLTSRVVTLWYRPPELLLGATDYGVAVDLWSSGCILAELFVGKPIMPGRTEVEQLHKIFKLCGSPSEGYWKKSKLTNATVFKPQQSYKRCVAEMFKDFPSSAISLVETLLAFEPEVRGTTASALQSEFFMTNPLPCDPSSLPKYPPSKELDAKMRDEEARRQRAAGGKGDGVEHSTNGLKDSKVSTQFTNTELSLQNQREQSKSNCSTDFYNPDDNIISSFHPTRGNSGTRHYTLRCASGNSLHMAEGINLDAASSVHGELKTQRSFKPRAAAAAAAAAQRFLNARYEPMDGADSSNSRLTLRKEKPKVYSPKKSLHYSGPLLPSGGNMEEMLKEHEKQIQSAIRKALAGKKKEH